MNNKYNYPILFGRKKNENKHEYELINNDIDLLKQMEYNNNNQSYKTELLDYQKSHANKLIKILNKNNTALDASDPGIGKTYIASYICKTLNLTPIVICPKNVVNNWINVLEKFKVKYLMVVNYELISRGKYMHKNAKLVSPYINIINKDRRIKYEWSIDPNVIFIFDEVHRCKYLSTMNAKLLLAAKETNNKILMLSATVVEKPTEFAIFAYILGFSLSLKLLVDWIKKLSTPAKTIHTMLYNNKTPKAARLTINELGDKFPDTQITADTYTMKDSNEISKEYDKIAKKIKQFKEEGDKSKFIIAKLQTEFRNIELLKIPTFIELTNDYLENNFSVVIFVNYTDTLKILAKKLNTDVLIYGGQSAKEREININKFQSDKARIIIANIKAGGIGISLHDINGKHPRVALISPTQSATNLIQALGRIYRSGAKSKSLQRIIFAANTPEDDISKMLFRKLSNLSLLNDGDLESYYIDGLIKDEYIATNNSNNALNKDLAIVIDDQLEKIKYKNLIKTNNLSKLFPDIIDTISGADSIYLLKGKYIFNNKEILLLGEYHDLLDPCKYCNAKCIEVINIVTYAMYTLEPNLLDFYIESPYNPNIVNKFAYTVKFPHLSRLEKLHRLYKHLLDTKYPVVENLRMHAVDIRHSAFNKQENKILNIYASLYLFTFNTMQYGLNDILTKGIKTYDNNKKLFDMVAYNLKDFYKIISDTNNMLIIKDIVNGNDKLNKLFKITKQKDKLLKNYGDNIIDFLNNLNKQIKGNFSAADKVYNYILYIKSILNSINNIENNKKYMKKFMTMILNDKELYDRNINHPLSLFMDTISYYMDHYTIYRMLRKFDNKEQKNILFYGGSFHSNNICRLLLKTNYFKLIVKQKEIYNENNDCKILKKI